MKKILFFLSTLIVLGSCVKQKFDEPTLAGSTIDFTSNSSIDNFKKTFKKDTLQRITENIIIEGEVVGNDETGNIYKAIFIQDATGGIEIKLNTTGLYNNFVIGTKVFVKCKGSMILKLGDLIQIGGGSYVDTKGKTQLAGIEQTFIQDFVFPGKVTNEIKPLQINNLSELGPNQVGTLVQLNNIEFVKKDVGVLFSDAAAKQYNRSINMCSSGSSSLIVYTSSFATFAKEFTPTGNGTGIFIYTTYNNAGELLMRNSSELKMTNARCDGSTGGGTGGGSGATGDPITIGAVRTIFTGTKTTVTANKLISGVVISDAVNKNWNPQNCIVQGADGKGIMIRFAAAHPFLLGDAVEIGVGSLELSEFNGTLQINGVPLANAKKVGDGTLPTPKKVTIAQLIGDIKAYESTLVAIDNCSHPATKYGGNVTIDDKTGKMTLFTASAATFANSAPVSNVLNLVGIAGPYVTTNSTAYQILMRNTGDATKGVGGGGTGGGTYAIEPIGTLRSYFTGTKTTAPAGKGIKGIVISDGSGKNINNQNLILQGSDGRGILVRLTAPHTYPLGESLEIDASNIELSEYNGLLQLNKVPPANVKDNGLGTLPTPKVITLAQLATDAEMLESTLVQVNNVDFVGATKFGGTIQITDDGTTTFALFSQPGGTVGTTVTAPATFATNVPPAGNKNTLTAIVSQFTAYQLLMRNASDVK
jgi:hypothetical protein